MWEIYKQKNNLKIVTFDKKAQTSLVIQLNIVTIAAQSVRLLRVHVCEDVHATRQLHLSMMVWSVPNVQQMLLQFINVVHPRLTDSLLDDAPHLVGLVDRIEVRTVHWPQIQKFQLLTFTR